MYRTFPLVFLALTVTASGNISGSSPVDPVSWTVCNEIYVNQTYCDNTCTIFGICYHNSKQEYVFTPIDNCTNYCTSTGCSNEPDSNPALRCYANSDTIGCTEEGIYPDPYDCRRSLHCSPESGVYPCTVCKDGYYNSKTGSCENTLTNGQCPSSVSKVCLRVGDTYAIANDPRFFYTCNLDGGTLIPVMDKCPQGGHFDKDTMMCVPSRKNDVPETYEECNASTITTTGPSTPLSTPPSTPPTTPPSTHICNKEGYVCDPKECHKYYYCDANLIPTHMICNPGKHCDTGSNTCVSGETCSRAGA